MKQTCDACKHWKVTDYNFGKCSNIQEKIEVEIDAGYTGGVVEYIETEADFGCNLFEDKKDSIEDEDKIQNAILKAYEG